MKNVRFYGHFDLIIRDKLCVFMLSLYTFYALFYLWSMQLQIYFMLKR